MSVHYLPYGLPEKGDPVSVTCGAFDPKINATSLASDVTCPDCIRLARIGTPTPLEYQERLRRAWTIQVVGGDTDLSLADWLYLHGHSKVRPARHTPPDLDPENGTFTFHDVHITGCTLEVVPQLSGNVEITVAYGDDGHFTTLHHLDRADLIRALLHDFHYSPERGGPNDDDN